MSYLVIYVSVTDADAELLRSIMEQLMINSHGKETDYPWMTAAAAGSEEGGGASSSEGKNKLKMAAAAAARRRRTRTLQNSFGRKTTIKVRLLSVWFVDDWCSCSLIRRLFCY